MPEVAPARAGISAEYAEAETSAENKALITGKGSPEADTPCAGNGSVTMSGFGEHTG